MSRFAFLIHPLRAKDSAKRYPWMRLMPDRMIEAIGVKMRPKVTSEITGIKSITGAEATGLFIGVPMTPRMFLEMPVEFSYEQILRACEIAKAEGAKIIGLGAFTSVVGDGGITVAGRTDLPITTGNSYTVATAIQGAEKACALMEIDPSQATLAVVGATGSIGKTCAQVMAPDFARTLVIGRDAERTQAVAAMLPRAEASTDIEDLRQADVIVTVTSSDTAIIQPQHLRPGAVVCDVSRPRDVSVRVVKERPDVLVIEGGVVKVPGPPEFNFDFGFPHGTAYACMSETMLLALENRFESFTLGKDVSPAQVTQTREWADKHGFMLEGFRAFERAVGQDRIDAAKAARQAVSSSPPSAAASAPAT